MVQPFVPSDTAKLQLTCRGDDFLNCFNFMHDTDPTQGYVEYVDQATADSLGMIQINPDQSVRLGSIVGQRSPAKSIRLESKQTFQTGIFVIDIAHMPTGLSTWPAWWLFGSNPVWPNSGEIDIIETVNGGPAVSTLHTSAECSMPTVPGISNGGNCNAAEGHDGCGVPAPPDSGSAAFNSGGGGVFAMRWTEQGISMWFFARGQVPFDHGSDDPNLDSWGQPYVTLPTGEGSSCSASHFKNMQFVLNLDFCGVWAGNVFPGGLAACEGYVSDPNNIEALAEAYWSVNYIKVFAAAA